MCAQSGCARAALAQAFARVLVALVPCELVHLHAVAAVAVLVFAVDVLVDAGDAVEAACECCAWR